MYIHTYIHTYMHTYIQNNVEAQTRGGTKETKFKALPQQRDSNVDQQGIEFYNFTKKDTRR